MTSNNMTLESSKRNIIDRHSEMENNNKIKRKATKSVRFADDHGFLLVKNFNIPSQCTNTNNTSLQTPAKKKLSKVTNFTECHPDNNSESIYLESTATTKSGVFGTLALKDTTIDTDLLRVLYSWDSRTTKTTQPFLVVPGKTGRLLFKVPVPRLKSKISSTPSDESRSTLLVNFYITYKGKRLPLNEGKDFVATWSSQR